MIPESSLLNTDLYQLNMLQTYLEKGMTETAVFELFVRKLPDCRNFLMAAGLPLALDHLETCRFEPEALDWLKASGRFSADFVSYLASFRFTGEVDAVPEGTVFFPDEPILRITAPLPEAQLLETQLMNMVQFQTVIASKAARMVLAAPGRALVDFGLRRAHGPTAGVWAARAAYVAGFTGTATVLAGARYGVPIYGTMAHSFIQAHDDETAAFEDFARSHPDDVVLLIDTYDTERAAERVVALKPALDAAGITIRGVRIDSGNLAEHARRVRRILDAGGLDETIVFASGGLDEHDLARFTEDGVPIEGYGIGTSVTTASDAPALDCAYKLQEYAGTPRLKLSEGKVTWPGRKQVFRRTGADGLMQGDLLALEDETAEGAALMRGYMRAGRRLGTAPDLAQARAHAARELARLPAALRSLGPGGSYSVVVSDSLRRLAEATGRSLREAADL